jgi:hypothetical protein
MPNASATRFIFRLILCAPGSSPSVYQIDTRGRARSMDPFGPMP